MNEFAKIDKELSMKVNAIRQISDSLIFNENFQFKIEKEQTHLSFETLKFPGIYFFEIQNNHGCDNISSFLTEFKNKWEHEDYKPHFVPNTIAKRLICHSEPLE